MDINDIHLFQSTAKILPVPFHGCVKEKCAVTQPSWQRGRGGVIYKCTQINQAAALIPLCQPP